jgi:hypothetical protein
MGIAIVATMENPPAPEHQLRHFHHMREFIAIVSHSPFPSSRFRDTTLSRKIQNLSDVLSK